MIFPIKYLYMIGATAILLIGGYFWLRHNVYEQCKADYETKRIQELAVAQESIRKKEIEYEKQIRRLQAQGDSGYGIGPRSIDVYNGLRHKYSSE